MTYDNIKSHKKSGLHPLSIRYSFKKNKRGVSNFNDSHGFIEYSNHMDGIYKSIEEYSPNKKTKPNKYLENIFDIIAHHLQ